MWEVNAFLTKTRTIFITNACVHGLAYSNISRIHVSVILTTTASVTIPEFENNQEFRPNHNFIIIEYHNFWQMINYFFWNV